MTIKQEYQIIDLQKRIEHLESEVRSLKELVRQMDSSRLGPETPKLNGRSTLKLSRS
jgi:hypothetical protein